MASILDLNSGSSDSEDDVDYVPPAGHQSSEDECSDDETELCDEPLPKKMKPNDQQKNDTLSKTESPANCSSANDVWKNFLNSVESTPYGRINGKPNGECSSSNATSLLEDKNKLSETETEKDVSKPEEENVPVNNEAVPEKDSLPVESEKKTVSEDSDDKSVTDIMSSDKNKETSGVIKNVDVAVTRPRAGLSSILGTLGNKGKKQSVLDKSLQDWRSFKQEEGIDKDLETFNKGRQGYVERQRFLERSDLRSFENEKNIRLSGRKK